VRNLLRWGASAPLTSAISPPGSSCSLSPSSPVGWRCRSHLSSCCCWRSSASSFSTSRPTPASKQPSSPTSKRCSWGWRPIPPSSVFLRVGEIWKGQGPSRCLLLPDKAGFSRCLHPHLRRREVGKLVWRLGGRQRRGQRPPHPAERRAKTRPEAVEGQAIPCAGVPVRTGHDQELGGGRPNVDARGR
jgi:hypothetical protein